MLKKCTIVRSKNKLVREIIEAGKIDSLGDKYVAKPSIALSKNYVTCQVIDGVLLYVSCAGVM